MSKNEQGGEREAEGSASSVTHMKTRGITYMIKLFKKIAHTLKGTFHHYDLLTEAGERWNFDSWNRYPRPQLKRSRYLVLKDKWLCLGDTLHSPFPPQSLLSGYKKKVNKEVIFTTIFHIPRNFTEPRILVHFGAVDQTCEIYLNNTYVGKHEGGYLSFTFEVTDLIRWNSVNDLMIVAQDPLSKNYPYGKQKKKRGGMWYTPVSGVWQTVWVENVPPRHIENVIMKPDLQGVHVQLETLEQTGFDAEILLENGETISKSFSGKEGYLNLAEHICENGQPYEPKLWSPEDPHLYTMRISCGRDKVETYFALRTVSIQKIEGINRVCLNNKPIFMHGVLDQGYFSDGIYTPAEPEEFERDILRMKELGFNMLRKHIKIEPELFYYYCDKHGMLVVQDMVNNGGYSYVRDTVLPNFGKKTRKDNVRGKKERKQIFKEQTKGTIAQLYNHPSIIVYTIFNEGWGQFDSDEMYDYVRSLDDSRLIDSTSGWFWQEKSDFDSEHIYFKSIELEPKERPMFLSECGGYSRKVKGHVYRLFGFYGYGKMKTEEELTNAIVEMYETMIVPAVKKGLCGAVYTQLSDVEDELNGLYTYDRRVCKVAKEPMQKLAEKLHI